MASSDVCPFFLPVVFWIAARFQFNQEPHETSSKSTSEHGFTVKNFGAFNVHPLPAVCQLVGFHSDVLMFDLDQSLCQSCSLLPLNRRRSDWQLAQSCRPGFLNITPLATGTLLLLPSCPFTFYNTNQSSCYAGRTGK